MQESIEPALQEVGHFSLLLSLIAEMQRRMMALLRVPEWQVNTKGEIYEKRI
jgi:hypothetical protein